MTKNKKIKKLSSAVIALILAAQFPSQSYLVFAADQQSTDASYLSFHYQTYVRPATSANSNPDNAAANPKPQSQTSTDTLSAGPLSPAAQSSIPDTAVQPPQGSTRTASNPNFYYALEQDSASRPFRLVLYKREGSGFVRRTLLSGSYNREYFNHLVDVSPDGRSVIYAERQPVSVTFNGIPRFGGWREKIYIQRTDALAQKRVLTEADSNAGHFSEPIIQSIRFEGGTAVIQSSQKNYRINLTTLEASVQTEILPLPEGWTRAASNPNYALGIERRRQTPAMDEEILKLLDLRTSQIKEIAHVNLPNQRPILPLFDISPENTPGGPVVIYELGGSNRGGAAVYSVIVERIQNSQERLVISDGIEKSQSTLRSITFNEDRTATLKTENHYLDGRVVVKVTMVNLSTLTTTGKVQTSPDGNYRVILGSELILLDRNGKELARLTAQSQQAATTDFSVTNKGVYVSGTERSNPYLSFFSFTNFTQAGRLSVELPPGVSVGMINAPKFVEGMPGVADITGTDFVTRRVDLEKRIILSSQDKRENQILQLYRESFNREADADGLKYWKGTNLPIGQIRSAFQATPEYRSLQIKKMYETLLQRVPGVEEVDYWASQRKDLPLNQIREEFVKGGEYLNKISDSTEWVKKLYRDLFGREADTGGLNYWASLLGKGASRLDVVQAFLATSEYRNRTLS